MVTERQRSTGMHSNNTPGNGSCTVSLKYETNENNLNFKMLFLQANLPLLKFISVKSEK